MNRCSQLPDSIPQPCTISARTIPASRIPAWLAFAVCVAMVVLTGGFDRADAQVKKYRSPNLKVPKDLDLKKADALRGMIDDFHRAEEVSPSGKPMVDVAKRLKKSARKIDVALTHFYLGRAYQNLRQLDASVDAFDACLALNPSFHEAHGYRAQVLYRKHDYSGALKGFEGALAVLATYSPALDGASRSLLRLGKPAEAMVHAQNALKVDPTDDRKDYVKQLAAFLEGPGWDETHEGTSEHFRIRTDISKRTVDRYLEEAEQAHRMFCRAYPILADKLGERKLAILIFGELDAYRASGAFGEDDGYYNPLFTQLSVARTERSEGITDALKGQGFIQHAHAVADEVPYWFEQGNRLHFRAALLDLVDDKDFWIRPPEGTFRSAVSTIRLGKMKPLRDFMLMDSEEFEEEPRHMHQAWSIVYYCLQGGAKKYTKALRAYFKALIQGQSAEQAYDESFGKLNEKRFVSDLKRFICDVLPKKL